MTHPAITAVAELLTRYNPRFATANYAPVKRWLAEGCDLDLDILPTIRAWTARKPDIYSLGFFSPHVREAREARMKGAPLSDHDRARNIAFLIRRMGRCMPTEERWLERFEAEHGVVKIR